jgi:hypothetical protein
MEWYWWVLIAVAVVVIGYVKMVVGKRMLETIKERREAQEAALED